MTSLCVAPLAAAGPNSSDRTPRSSPSMDSHKSTAPHSGGKVRRCLSGCAVVTAYAVIRSVTHSEVLVEVCYLTYTCSRCGALMSARGDGLGNTYQP